MRKPIIVALAAASLLASAAGTAATAASSDSTVGDKKVCAAPAKAGLASCHAHVRTKGAKPDATSTYQSGYQPSDLISAYNLAGASGTATIAVVDAYNNPNAAGDLAAYRTRFGLGPANLTIVNQNGATSPLAAGDVGWGQEEMLDLEMVSAICPACPIVYVGGNSASFADLGTAVNTAVSKMHATVVSNSYGAAEFSGESSYAAAYNHPNVAITVSSGDNGYGVEVPAAFNTVTAVGGTNLKRSSTLRGWTETAWTGAGSGCSALISKNTTLQKDTACSRRTVADVSAIADPNTGVAVYDSYGSGSLPWMVFGGTSVAAPIIAGVYGLAGALPSYPAATAYANKSALNDVTSGSNGRCVRGKSTSGAYLCTGVVGYDGPTGLGTPNGIGAF